MTSLDGLTLLVPTLEVEAGLVVTAFTQSMGAELLVNGDFASWEDGLPTGWTTFVTPGNLVETAADGSAGTGAAHFISAASQDPSIQQDVLTAATWHQIIINMTAYTNGLLLVRDTAGYFPDISVAGERYLLVRPADATLILRAGFVPPHDFVIDSVSVKAVTLNPVWAMPSANGTHTLAFTLPASPKPGQRIEMRYRQQDDLNYWSAYIARNVGNTAWDFKLDVMLAGTAFNRVSVTNVGDVDAVRVVTAGNIHSAYTGASGVFTQRGADQNLGSHASQLGITALYSDTFIPLALTSVAT